MARNTAFTADPLESDTAAKIVDPLPGSGAVATTRFFGCRGNAVEWSRADVFHELGTAARLVRWPGGNVAQNI